MIRVKVSKSLDYWREMRNRDTLAGAKASRQGQMKNDEINPARVAANGEGWTIGDRSQ